MAASAEVGSTADRFSHRRQPGHSRVHRLAHHAKRHLLRGRSRANGAERAPIILAGLGLTGIIYCGAIDLSIGALLGLAGTVFGILHARGAPPLVCFSACFATAFVLSAYNGLLVWWLRIPAIIVTLAGLAFYRGAALILADVAASGSANNSPSTGLPTIRRARTTRAAFCSPCWRSRSFGSASASRPDAGSRSAVPKWPAG